MDLQEYGRPRYDVIAILSRDFSIATVKTTKETAAIKMAQHVSSLPMGRVSNLECSLRWFQDLRTHIAIAIAIAL
jgi:hypothetical protein